MTNRGDRSPVPFFYPRRTLIAMCGGATILAVATGGCAPEAPKKDHIPVNTQFFHEPPLGDRRNDPACGVTQEAVDVERVDTVLDTSVGSSEVAFAHEQAKVFPGGAGSPCEEDGDGKIWRPGPTGNPFPPQHGE